MRIIQSQNNIEQLKQLSILDKALLNKVEEDFRWMLNEYKSLGCEYTPEKNGITVILEAGDISDVLKHIGISPLKHVIPEFVDEFDLRGITYTKSLILFNNEYSVMLYANPSEIDKEFQNWINKNL
ncbi:MAG: hypothetical protein N4A62_09415 [Marinisporobacter sp.]|jgi:hypothetical protein|nr:hypothetical protein [Marinisporobacter sp.]